VLVFAKALDVVQLQLWLWDVVPFEMSCARFVPCEFELCDIVSVTVSSYDMGGLSVWEVVFSGSWLVVVVTWLFSPCSACERRSRTYVNVASLLPINGCMFMLAAYKMMK